MGLSSNVPNIGLPFKILVLLFLHVLGASSLYSRQQQLPTCHAEERAALLQFKESFAIDPSASRDGGAYPKVSTWKSAKGDQNRNCCSWDGVECDENNGHVTRLDLSSSCLYGSINSTSSLFGLVHLRSLNLADNNFNYSQIPTTIRNLSRLRYLNLSYSVFSGQVPSKISQLSKLLSLDLSGNLDYLSGERLLKLKVPNLGGLVQNWTSLEKLRLSDIIISSTIPDSFANLSFLSSLALRNCDLVGEIPSSFGNLTQLVYLSLSNNELSGPILSSFGNLTQLVYLSLYNNELSGPIPSSFGNLTQLVYLSLSYNKLSGPIPCSLGNLTRLNYLEINYNSLNGAIPESLFNLVNLYFLKLYSNELRGNLDICKLPSSLTVVQIGANKLEVSQCIVKNTTLIPKLTTLVLSECNIKEFPNFVRHQQNLTSLDISGNELHGQIPIWMWNTSTDSLEFLDLSYNFLSGFGQPDVVLPWVNLQVLFLDDNLLDGPPPMPAKNIAYYRISDNRLTGELSPLMCNLTSLQYLDLASNKLSGTIPQCLGNFSDVLQALNLRNNTLRGSLPETYSNKSQLKMLDVSYNQLHGKLPRSLANLTSLQYLDLSNNKFSGTIPPCLGNFSDVLQVLNLRNNTLRGSLPETYSNKSQLKMLDVSYNQLHGKLPRSLANCVMIEAIVLSENKFSDVFPIWLGNFPQLKLLALHRNEFYGVIEDTKENLHFPELHILDMSYNNFTGEFPIEYIFSGNAMRGIVLQEPSYMHVSSNPDRMVLQKSIYTLMGYQLEEFEFTVTITNKGVEIHYSKIQEDLMVIDISSNNFHGKIPEFIGNLKGLRLLNISNNIFTGSIPSVLENLTLLESLDLSQNQLSGEIPQQLAELTSLAYFNVSYNNLTGSIPQGPQFQTFENTSFEGNPGLCGDPLTKTCQNSNPTAQLPPSSSIEETEVAFQFDWKFVLAGVVSGLVVGVVLSDVVITRKRELFLDIVGMMIRQMKRIRRHLRRY